MLSRWFEEASEVAQSNRGRGRSRSRGDFPLFNNRNCVYSGCAGLEYQPFLGVNKILVH